MRITFIMLFFAIMLNGCDTSQTSQTSQTSSSMECLNSYVDKIKEPTLVEYSKRISNINSKKQKDFSLDDSAMDEIDFISAQTGIMAFICFAKYSQNELNYNDIRNLIRSINMDESMEYYELTLHDNTKVEIPVISRNIGENLALNIAHFVYMHQNQSVDDLLSSILLTTKLPTTYNYRGCNQCYLPLKGIKLTIGK